MDRDAYWALVERARAAAGEFAGDRDLREDPLPDAVVAQLGALSGEELVEFSLRHGEIVDSAYRWPLWHAAHLIEGGCGDDGFADFRDGLVLQGRAVFEAAVADPDSLADLPVVLRMAREGGGWLGYESMSHLVRDAYKRARGESDSLLAAVAERRGAVVRRKPDGEQWDVEDPAENRARLPRLAELFES
ncbi:MULTISPECIES: DUF4240 domain-containing protein [Actinosynnema]|uniref:DUF4240 domain-containing protein n=1 Tax=Actinosynnema pretiosum TaxID=42197 RepID=A0A290ZAI6_9PSEU|nr:DUF4240 domain-containing protein [Actinosynnema pretiosum]ATE56051.1 hypothetical protein CNX65_24550 [Actinosynnema pretiosum]